VNGTILGGLLLSASDDGDAVWALLIPLAVGIGLIVAGYMKFRHGEEVEAIQAGAKKAALADGQEQKDWLSGGLELLSEVSGVNVKDLTKWGRSLGSVLGF
jgi:hypothetical protein